MVLQVGVVGLFGGVLDILWEVFIIISFVVLNIVDSVFEEGLATVFHLLSAPYSNVLALCLL